MNEVWFPETSAGRILYGLDDSLYGMGYYGSLDWYDTSSGTQTYAIKSNTSVSYTNGANTSVTYTNQTLGTQTWT